MIYKLEMGHDLEVEVQGSKYFTGFFIMYVTVRNDQYRWEIRTRNNKLVDSAIVNRNKSTAEAVIVKHVKDALKKHGIIGKLERFMYIKITEVENANFIC